MLPKDEFRIHWAVWNDDVATLEGLLKNLPTEKLSRQKELEKLDPRGRTPLLLAVSLGHLRCVELLLKNGANATAENKQYWTVVDEAVASADPEMVSFCLRYRDFQRFQRRRRAVTELLEKLSQAADFYVQMKWEFHSWIPFVSKVCPSDTYRVYKRGRDVRIDTTLLGFDNGEWKRGQQTFIFKAKVPFGAEFIIIDHELQTVFVEEIPAEVSTDEGQFQDIEAFIPSQDAIATRLTSPVAVTYVDVEKITFERKQGGLLGFKSDKIENINGYQSKVYLASNVELITKVRTEHLLAEDKQAFEGQQRNMMESLMNWFQGSESNVSIGGGDVKPEEYFNSFCSLGDRDVGRKKEISARCRKFNATLWLAENYPLSLSEQVLPIVDLMASTNAHFARLRNFITLQLPAGFPIKIEIPLFHLITASVSFENVNSETAIVDGITRLFDDETKCCAVDDALFDIPRGYSVREMSSKQHIWTENEEDALLQYAIQQSISGGKSRATIPIYFSEEEIALQKAIDASLRGAAVAGCYESTAVSAEENPPISPVAPLIGDDLAVALAVSLQEEEERRKAIELEEAELEQILKLSLNDK